MKKVSTVHLIQTKSDVTLKKHSLAWGISQPTIPLQLMGLWLRMSLPGGMAGMMCGKERHQVPHIQRLGFGCKFKGRVHGLGMCGGENMFRHETSLVSSVLCLCGLQLL